MPAVNNVIDRINNAHKENRTMGVFDIVHSVLKALDTDLDTALQEADAVWGPNTGPVYFYGLHLYKEDKKTIDPEKFLVFMLVSIHQPIKRTSIDRARRKSIAKRKAEHEAFMKSKLQLVG